MRIACRAHRFSALIFQISVNYQLLKLNRSGLFGIEPDHPKKWGKKVNGN